MPQLEEPTAKNTQLCTGGLWGEKGKNKIFKKKNHPYELGDIQGCLGESVLISSLGPVGGKYGNDNQLPCFLPDS